MTPSSQLMEPPGIPGRFTLELRVRLGDEEFVLEDPANLKRDFYSNRFRVHIFDSVPIGPKNKRSKRAMTKK